MNITAITLGCKVNQYESQAMLAAMERAGFHVDAGPADVVLINSCTVTAQSDHKVRQALRRARRENPGAVLVLTGCMPQAFPEAAGAMQEADIVLGNSDRLALPGYVEQFLKTHERIVAISPHKAQFEPMEVHTFHDRTRAFVKIEDGCNRFCSYCIIPYARGRVRSKPLSDLQAELSALGENGYREVVLTGINLPAYGEDLGLTLCDAVEAACAVPGIARVRLGSLEPEQLEEDVVRRLARQEKLCPQFHLALQSGCDRTLSRMNRHYDTALYREIAQRLRAAFPNAALTTDLMVGFPGETEEDFAESLAFVEEIAFAKVHVFAYSRRPDTRADTFPNQVPKAEKERRSAAVIAAAARTRRAFLKAQCGLTEEVLFEQQKRPGLWEGYTPNYTPVFAESDAPLSGKLCSVRICSLDEDGDGCRGEIFER